jgi:hypothetical protein
MPSSPEPSLSDLTASVPTPPKAPSARPLFAQQPARVAQQPARVAQQPARVAQLPARPVLVDDLVPPHDLSAFEARLAAVTGRGCLQVERLGWVGGWPLHVVRWGARSPRLRVLVSAGVHGIEPAGPAAVLLFLEQMLDAPEQYADVEVTAIPLVNPVGYHARTRGNADRVDLNRAFTGRPGVPREVALLRDVLGGPFDLGIDLHSSRSSGMRGYFALHRDALDLLAPAMRRFGERYPLLCEGTDRYVLDTDGVLRSSNNGTLKDYLADTGVRWAVTIEAPVLTPYPSQVRGSADVVHTLIATARALM